MHAPRKPLIDATVDELDRLAAAHDVPDYPNGGKRAAKLAAVSAVLGDDFEFEVEGEFAVKLVAEPLEDHAEPPSVGMFADPRTGDRVELQAGQVFVVFRERHRVELLRFYPFLEAAD